MEVSTAFGLVLIVLKLIGTITWSWWLVTLPIYLPFLLSLFLLITLFLKDIKK